MFKEKLQKIKEKNSEELLQLAFDLEFDFIYVLADMENNGIKIDVNLLKELKETNYKYTYNSKFKDDKSICVPYLIGSVPEGKMKRFIKAMNKI